MSEDVSRNEPCPCGSGKKYKRCHGVSAPPKLSTPAAAAPGAGPDPSQMLKNMDPQAVAQMQQALARIPRGQLQKLQGLMQRAMSGKDVSQEAADFEQNLPSDLQEQLRGLGMQMMAAQGGAGAPAAAASPGGAPGELTEEEAKAIVAAAAAEGKISAEQASALGVEQKKKGLGSFFGLKK